MRKIKINKNYVVPAIITLLIIVGVVTALIIGDTRPKKAPVVAQNTACGPYRHDATLTINRQNINVEVVTTQAALQKGLGGRPCILADQGMLFVFPNSGVIPIWMKDMKFPIDVLWLNADKRVVGQEIDMSPKTYPDKFINKDKPAKYVLELKANRSEELHMEIGSAVQFKNT